jgi:hypothetical protein
MGVPPAVTFARCGCLVALLVTLVACASARPERSSYGCMAKTLRQHLPADLPDKSAHCLAAGLIARYCSTAEAHLAAAGKELRDLFGRGDASGADWQASRIGINCARRTQDDEALSACCSTTPKKSGALNGRR